MEIAFANKQLRSICQDNDKAERELGPSVSKKLKLRLADLRAASTIYDLPPIYNSIEITSHNIKIGLENGYEILCQANHIPNPLTESGTIDWKRVRRIKILSIG